MRKFFLSILALIGSLTAASAQDAAATAPGKAMITLHVASINQPLLPFWYGLIYVCVALVAIFFIYVLYRTFKDKTYLG